MSYSIFFSFNFCISLCAIFILSFFQSGIENYIRQNAKQLLTGELSISARRDLTDSEKELLQKNFSEEILRTSENINTYSMLYKEERSRLVLIKAVDAKFPLFGEVLLGDEQSNAQVADFSALKQKPILWVYPEVLVQLGLKIGDQVKLGKKNFEVKEQIIKDVGLGGFGSALAPAVYMSMDQLQETGLVGFGATAWYTRYLDIRDDDRLEEIKNSLNEMFPDPALRISSFDNANEQIGRLQNYLGDYLGLVALVSLLLTIVGAYYLFRSHLVEQAKSISLMEINGASSSFLTKVFLFQIVFLSTFSSGLSLLISGFLSKVWFGSLSLGIDTSKIELQYLNVVYLFLAILGFVLLCMYPFLHQFLKADKTQSLFESKNISWNWKLKDLLMFLPALLFFSFLSFLTAKSILVAGIFLSVLLLSLLATAFSFWLLYLISRKWTPKNLSLRYSLRFLSRDKFGAISILFAMGLSFLLMILVPQIKDSLERELLFPKKALLPDLFLFDIQDEQIQSLKEVLSENETELEYVSPMVRARLSTVNDKAFTKPKNSEIAVTREEEREMRFRNRGFNLSYRSNLAPSEKIIEGKFYGEDYVSLQDEYPAISVEKRFAERLDLKMGDVLSFDIQGVEIKGQIKSIRTVKWTSFQPNFFLQFQPGVLEDAPKTFLAAIGSLGFDKKQRIQHKIVERLPNISIVDVEYVVRRILDLFEKMAKAVSLLAMFSFLSGLFLVFVISNARSKERKKDFLYLKLFGASESLLSTMFLTEFMFVFSMASLSSFAINAAVSYFLVTYVFDSELRLNFQYPVMVFVFSFVFLVLLSLLASRKRIQSEEFTELMAM
ncbi:MAG: FtsX-like permease family protein [Bdellovibrionota bacterium]|nr:FtsX-like permease family protein [Bdellovibrionota bacterium]